MPQERAIFWLSVTTLLGVAILIGQISAVVVAAAIGIWMVHEQLKASAQAPPIEDVPR
jgi:hypothetical protein